MITPLPGAERTQVLDRLRLVEGELVNLRSRTVQAADAVGDYLRWIAESERLLRGQIMPKDVHALLYSEQLSRILVAGVGVVRPLLDTEIDNRLEFLRETVGVLDSHYVQWADQPGELIVLDTSLLLNHLSELQAIDLADELGLRGAAIRIVLPILVVEELDNSKRAQRGETRTRARTTLKTIAEVVGTGGRGRLREADFSALSRGGIPSDEVTLEVLFDPPGHTRLANPDDELVDRASSLTGIVGSQRLHFVTMDTAQLLRARFNGLNAHASDRRTDGT